MARVNRRMAKRLPPTTSTTARIAAATISASRHIWRRTSALGVARSAPRPQFAIEPHGRRQIQVRFLPAGAGGSSGRSRRTAHARIPSALGDCPTRRDPRCCRQSPCRSGRMTGNSHSQPRAELAATVRQFRRAIGGPGGGQPQHTDIGRRVQSRPSMRFARLARAVGRVPAQEDRDRHGNAETLQCDLPKQRRRRIGGSRKSIP